MPRYNQAQREEIRDTVLELYLMGARTQKIRQYLAEKKNVRLSDRQINWYVHDVKKEMRAAAKFERDEKLGQSLSRLDELFLAFKQGKDGRGALRVQREINLVCGLIVNRHEHKGASLEDWLKGGGGTAPEATPARASAGGGDDGSVPDDGGGDDDEPEPVPTVADGGDAGAVLDALDHDEGDDDEGPPSDAG